MFVFRGTEGVDLRGRTNCDWKHGNYALHQHERAVGIVKRFAATHRIDPQRLIFVGHSLGGGIAIHNSYRAKDSWVYAFNSSPKFKRPRPYPLTLTDAPLGPWSRRVSIAQRGEFLKIGRVPDREANQIYLPVNCTRGGMVQKHSMLALAQCLTIEASRGPASASQIEALASINLDKRQFSPERLAAEQERAAPLCRDGARG